jgi:hypothetical protein
MREIRTSGSEGGGIETNRFSLPLSPAGRHERRQCGSRLPPGQRSRQCFIQGSADPAGVELAMTAFVGAGSSRTEAVRLPAEGCYVSRARAQRSPG